MKEDREMINLNVDSICVSENCRYNQLEERSKKAEAMCAELEFALQKKNDQCVALEAKLKSLEIEKSAVEDELKVLRVSSKGPKRTIEVGNEKEREVETVVDLNDGSEVLQLMIENNVLECEKKRAESEVEAWKDKYKKLESRVLQLQQGMGNYYHEENEKKENNKRISIECSSQLEPILDSKVHPARQARKQLTFEIEESPSKRLAPCTPAGAKSTSVCVVDIIDSDDEPVIAQHPVLDSQSNRNISTSPSTCFVAENGNTSNCYSQNNEGDLNFGEDYPFVATPKRKRACNIVTSESEQDDDDNTPICKLKRLHIQEVRPGQVRCDANCSTTAATPPDREVTSTVTPRRRLMPLRKCARKNQEGEKPLYRSNKKAKHQQSIFTGADADASESEEDLSDCEDEGLSDFIVDDSDVSNGDDASSKSQDVSDGVVDSDFSDSQDVPVNAMDSDSQHVSDGDMDFEKILSQIQRRKDHKMDWEFEADILAAFGKDPELCMKAVCALYRQQTSDEQLSRGTRHSNRRGFNKFDAHRGSKLAEFLTLGDPCGGLKKSVKELEEYDPKGVELCRTLAIHYSRQLYEIYKNKEDPFFP